MTGVIETITRDELAKALAVGCMSGEITLSAVSDVVADGLFKIVLNNREPEYEPGGAYVDARGDNYLRSSSGGWVDYSTTWHPHGSPRRPLRRLVPDHAHPDHAVILAEIVAWADTGYVFKDLADRMCRLLEGAEADAAPPGGAGPGADTSRPLSGLHAQSGDRSGVILSGPGHVACDTAIAGLRARAGEAGAECAGLRESLAAADNAIGQVIRRAMSWRDQGGQLEAANVARILLGFLEGWTGIEPVKDGSEEGP